MGKKRKAAALQEHSEPKHAHIHTDAHIQTGLGIQVRSAPGRLAAGPLAQLCTTATAAKWAPPAVAPSACIKNPAAAVELEIARATTLDQLRRTLRSLCAKAGLRNVPLLAFERWRFAAKWAEEEPHLASAVLFGSREATDTAAATALDNKRACIDGSAASSDGSAVDSSKKGQQKVKSNIASSSSDADPMVPFGTLPAAPEPGLVGDLIRAGIDQPKSTQVAWKLAQAAADAAAGLVKRRHQLVSGKAPNCPAVTVAFHKHSLDLICKGHFVKVSRTGYGKLARLYRQHWLSRSGTVAAQDCLVGLPVEQALAKLAAAEAAAAAAGLRAAESIAARHSAAATAAAAKTTGGSITADSDDSSGTNDFYTSDAARVADGTASQCAAAFGAADNTFTRQNKLAMYAEARLAELTMLAECTNAAVAAAAASAAAPANAVSTETFAVQNGGDSSSSSNERAALHQWLFALLLRYKSIQGHGYQAAAGPTVFDVLKRHLAIGFECFASPMNTHFSCYGSAFSDVDGPFGSAGSFFRMNLKHGSYEANPPFVPAILTATAKHILTLLQAAEAAQAAVSFTVLMPGWTEVEGWKLLQQSSFLRNSLMVAAADHGYCDGASHQRKDLFRQSPYDSGILFLQTSAAAAKWPVREILLQQLQAAFADCCPSTAAVNRQHKQRGHTDLESERLGAPVDNRSAAVVAAAATTAGVVSHSVKHGKKHKGPQPQPLNHSGVQQQLQQQQQNLKPKKRKRQKHM